MLNRGEKLEEDRVEKAKLLHDFFVSLFVDEFLSQK